MKRTWKERLVIASILLFFMALPALGGLIGKPDYDVVWRITVIDCQGKATVYEHCRIVNVGPGWIYFMPNQGQIASGNGKEVHISTDNSCTQVIKEEE
jgi:hypothetical protein